MREPYLQTFSARGLPILCAKIGALLVALHLVVMTIYWRDVIPPESYDLHWWQVAVFDLDTEESFGTWFSAILLLVAGRFLWLQARQARAAGQGWVVWWFVLAIGFHFLSLDEVVGLHEYLNETLDTHAAGMKWTHVLGPVALLVGLAYLPLLLTLPRTTAALFVLGGLLYLGGAVFIERYTDVYEEWGKLNTLEYHLWIALEEGLEMLGVIVFLRGLLGYMATDGTRVAVETRVES